MERKGARNRCLGGKARKEPVFPSERGRLFAFVGLRWIWSDARTGRLGPRRSLSELGEASSPYFLSVSALCAAGTAGLRDLSFGTPATGGVLKGRQIVSVREQLTKEVCPEPRFLNPFRGSLSEHDVKELQDPR
jgi:hypothetical protein